MRLSVELVPRSARDFSQQLSALSALASDLVAAGFDTVNVPSAPRYALHAVDACHAVAMRGWQGIPHLRSMDVLPGELDALIARLRASAVREVLVVAGDPPGQGAPRSPEMTPARLLEALAAGAPELRRYAAFDPNRRVDAAQLARIEAKLAAGAQGLFGQPAFTASAMQQWGDALAPRLQAASIWWGAAPVLGERSLRWWQRVNAIDFPADFAPTIEDWQRRLPQLVGCAEALGGQLYLMPIRAPLPTTLGPLLASMPVAAAQG